MRILALSSWWPEPADNGSRLRISHLLGALAQEHEVHLVALSQEQVQPAQRTRLEQVCASVHAVPQRTWTHRHGDALASVFLPTPASVRATWNPEFSRQVQECAAATRPDVVIAFQITAAIYARSIVGVPRVLEEVEVTYMLEQYLKQQRLPRRLRFWLTWFKHRQYLTNLLRCFDACTVVSQQEQAHVRTLAPRDMPIVVVPNGADVDSCIGPWGRPEADTLIYPGALSFNANLDAVVYFLTTSFPIIQKDRPQVRLRITGAVEPAQSAVLPANNGVELTGYVPDIRPVIARSWAEVVPLRVGGGTRLKVLEALALGTPVISTSKGVEGLDLEHDKHVLVADSVVDFATATSLM